MFHSDNARKCVVSSLSLMRIESFHTSSVCYGFFAGGVYVYANYPYILSNSCFIPHLYLCIYAIAISAPRMSNFCFGIFAGSTCVVFQHAHTLKVSFYPTCISVYIYDCTRCQVYIYFLFPTNAACCSVLQCSCV